MKKRYLIIIIVLLVLILGLGAGFAYTYFFTDMFKSNKQLFSKYIIQNSEISEIFKDKELTAYAEKQKNTPYTSEGTIKTNVTFPDSSQADLAKALQNCSISFSGKTDAKNNYTYSNIKANYSDTQALNFEFVQNNDVYAFKINDVLNKFIGIQNSNLKDLAKKFNLDEKTIAQIPDKLELNQANLPNSFDEETIKQLKNKYLSVITDNLTDDMFSKEKSNDNMVYTLTINESQATNILIRLLETIRDDEIIFNKVKDIMINEAKISDDEANKYIEQAKSYINELIEDCNQSIDSTSTGSKSQLVIKVYAQNGKLNKTEFTVEENSNPSTETNNALSPTDSSYNSAGVAYDNSQNSSNSTLKSPNGTIFSPEKKIAAIIKILKLTIIKTNDGARFECSSNTTNEALFSLSIQKIKSDNELKYDISSAYNNNQLFTLNIAFSGLNTDKVQESSELNFELDNSILGNSTLSNSTTNSITAPTNTKTTIMCTYNNTKTFGTEVLHNDVANNNILLVNTAPNAESVKKLFTQVAERLNKVNTEKMTNAGITTSENPFMYYIPSVVPFALTNSFSNPNNTLSYTVPSALVVSGIISIRMVTSNNSVLVRANQAKTTAALAGAKEEVTLLTVDIISQNMISNSYKDEDLDSKILKAIKDNSKWNFTSSNVTISVNDKNIILTNTKDGSTVRGTLSNGKITWDN